MPAYQYTITLNDLMSNPLQKMSVSANGVYDKLTGKQNKFNQSVGEGQRSISSYGSSFSSLKTIIGGFLSFQVGKTMLGWAADMEQTQVSFQTLTGSVEKGNRLFKDLLNYSNVTPYQSADINKAATTMLAFGIGLDKIMPDIKMLGDVAMGDSNKLGMLTLAFSQVHSTGRLMGQDLLQLVNAGFNPLQVISEKTGKSMAELKKEMEQGKISADMVTQAFIDVTSKGGRFYNMASKQSRTLAGMWSTLVDTFQTGFATAILNNKETFTKFMDKATTLVSKFVAYMPTIVGWLVKFMEALMGVAHWLKENWSWLSVVITVVGTFIGTLWLIVKVTQVWTAAQWLLNIAMTANPIGLIIAGIAALVALVVVAINKYDQWGAAILFLMGPLGMLINTIMIFKRNWDSITDAFTNGGIIAGLKRIGIVLLDTLLYPIQQLLELIAKIPGLGGLAGKGAAAIESLRNKLGLITPQESTSGSSTPGSSTDSISTAVGGNGNGSGLSSSVTTKAGIEGITGGGSKQTNIQISLNNLIGEFSINSSDVSQGVDQMRDMVTDALLRVLNSSNKLSYQQ